MCGKVLGEVKSVFLFQCQLEKSTLLTTATLL